MGAGVLDLGCTIQCPHGGQATVTSGNTRVKVGGSFAVLISDVTTVTGCPFNVGTSPVPCVTIQWLVPSARFTVTATPVLLETSLGLCLNAAGAPQGTAIVNGVQTHVQGV
jgi:hypothetical protein